MYVKDKESVNVNVTSSGESGGDTLAEAMSDTLTTYNGSATGIKSYMFQYNTNLISFKNNQPMKTKEGARNTFDGCTNMQEMDIEVTAENTSYKYFSKMFYQMARNATNPNINITLNQTTTPASYMDDMFNYAKANKVVFNNWVMSTANYLNKAFQYASINELHFKGIKTIAIPSSSANNPFYNTTYIGKIYMEVKQRPRYNIEKVRTTEENREG